MYIKFLTLSHQVLFVVGGTNVQVGKENCHVHNTTEFVMNGKTAKGPDLPMPISDACFVKINETFAILIGNYLSKV